MFATALAGVTSRASLENPSSSLSDPEDWVFETFSGGTRSSSGVRVNRKAALGYAAVWRAINLISRDVAKLPLQVFKRNPGGGKDRDRGHPAYRLLRRQPNKEMKAFDFKQTLMSHVLLEGNGYAYISRLKDGTPDLLVPLDPTLTHPARIDGELWYITKDIRNADGMREDRRLRPEDVLHIKGLGFDGLLGYNVIQIGKDTIGLGLAMKKFGSVFFKNHAIPGVVLEHPNKLSPEAKKNIIDGWKRLLTGLDKAHTTTVLEEGMKARLLTVDARKAQLAELRIAELREIANLLGVPPHKLGDPSRTSFSSLEQENQSYLDEALDPWLVQFEEECTAKLLTEAQKERDSHFIEFVREAIVRADLATRTESQNKRVLAGIVTRDEVRATENMNPLPGGIGKLTMRPANMILEDPDAEEVPPPTDPPPPAPVNDDDDKDNDGDDDDDRSAKLLPAHRGLIESVARRFHKRIALQAVRAASKPDTFIDWIDEGLTSKHRDAFVDALEPVVDVLVASGRSINSNDAATAVAKYLAEARESLLTAAECQPSELVRRIENWAHRDDGKWLLGSLGGETLGELTCLIG